jgi:hypothetical protein
LNNEFLGRSKQLRVCEVPMANSATDPKHRNCERCGEPVRQHGDYLRAQWRGSCGLFHWACFIQQMRESDQGNADASAGVSAESPAAHSIWR